jgi:hypothetical protein
MNLPHACLSRGSRRGVHTLLLFAGGVEDPCCVSLRSPCSRKASALRICYHAASTLPRTRGGRGESCSFRERPTPSRFLIAVAFASLVVAPDSTLTDCASGPCHHPATHIGLPVPDRSRREPNERRTLPLPPPPLERPLRNTEKRRRLSFTNETIASSVVSSTQRRLLPRNSLIRRGHFRNTSTRSSIVAFVVEPQGTARPSRPAAEAPGVLVSKLRANSGLPGYRKARLASRCSPLRRGCQVAVSWTIWIISLYMRAGPRSARSASSTRERPSA